MTPTGTPTPMPALAPVERPDEEEDAVEVLLLELLARVDEGIIEPEPEPEPVSPGAVLVASAALPVIVAPGEAVELAILGLSAGGRSVKISVSVDWYATMMGLAHAVRVEVQLVVTQDPELTSGPVLQRV